MKTRLFIKRKIAAAHYLPDYSGPCQNMHGHSWLVEAMLEGEKDQETGMLVDFRKIKDILDYCDHVVLNDVLPDEYLPPTAENLAEYFLNMIPGAVLVRVWESDSCFAECLT